MFRSGYSMSKTAALCAVVVLCATGRSASRPDEIPFEKHTIDLGSSETAVFADINRDGKLDLVSGEYWYEAPHWIKHRFREILYTNNYVDDLSTLPLDVDGDGYVDLVTSGWFTKKLAWWKNPGPAGGMWKEYPIATGSPIEFSFLVDLDNDGTADEILPQFGDDHDGALRKKQLSHRMRRPRDNGNESEWLPDAARCNTRSPRWPIASRQRE